MTTGIRNVGPEDEHALSAVLLRETRAKCQDFVAPYKDDGIPFEIESILPKQNQYRSLPVQVT